MIAKAAAASSGRDDFEPVFSSKRFEEQQISGGYRSTAGRIFNNVAPTSVSQIRCQ